MHRTSHIAHRACWDLGPRWGGDRRSENGRCPAVLALFSELRCAGPVVVVVGGGGLCAARARAQPPPPHPGGAARPALMSRAAPLMSRAAHAVESKASVRIEVAVSRRPPCLGCAVELVLRVAPLRFFRRLISKGRRPIEWALRRSQAAALRRRCSTEKRFPTLLRNKRGKPLLKNPRLEENERRCA
jgi:hypothetical protein